MSIEEHLTKVGGLKPSSIVYTAAVDLERRERNRKASFGCGFEHYAFHRKHVRKANTPKELVELALSDLAAGIDSVKRSTRIIYRDEDVLKAALKLMENDDARDVASSN